MSSDLPPLAPAPAPAPSPPGAVQAPRENAAIARVGLLIAALGGIIAAFAANQDAVSGEVGAGGITLTRSFGTDIAFIGGIAAAVLIALAFVPVPWARLVGAVVAFGLFATMALLGIGARSDDLFPSGESLDIETGLMLVLIGGAVALVGAVVTLIAIAGPPHGVRGPTGMSVAALVTGIVSLIVPVVGTVAAWLGRRGGGGMGWAGWVLGWLAVLGWSIGLAIGVFVVTP